MLASDQLAFGLVTALVAVVVVYALYLVRGGTKEPKEDIGESGANGVSTKKKNKQAQQQPQVAKKPKSKEPEKKKSDGEAHPWLATNLKAHQGSVLGLDFSLNEKFLASFADDRTAMIWMTKDFLISNHKQIRVNLGFDIATNLFWSPDSKAFVLSTKEDSSIQVFKLGKKPDGSVGNISQGFTIEKAHYGSEVVGLAIAFNGKFMLSASKDGKIKAWDLKGSMLEEYTASVKPLSCLKLSGCGRFVAFCGSSKKIFVWSVIYDKQGNFEKLKENYSLDGHAEEVHSLDFNLDGTNIVSVDKKGCWRLFDTTGTKATLRFSSVIPVDTDGGKLLTTISNDSRISAVSSGTKVHLFSAKRGSQLAKVETHYTDPISDIKFSADGKYFVTSAVDDRCIKIFHNICGYTEKVKDLKEQAKSPEISAHLKDRLLQEADAIVASVKQLNLKALS